MLGSYKHRVLSTYPLSSAALQRLSFFFDVEVASTPPGPPQKTLQLLQDVAGVITSEDNIKFEKDIVAQLPHLRAICLTTQAPKFVDLDALTEAGIRATGFPATPQNQVEETMWRVLTTEAQNFATRANGSALGQGSLRRFSGSLFTSSLYAMRIGFLGSSPLSKGLLARALKAQADARLIDLDDCSDGSETSLDWLVIPADWQAPDQPQPGQQLLQVAGPDTRIIDFSDAAAIRATAQHWPELAERITYRPVSSCNQAESTDPASLLAEQLIAALGFGRKSWHPDNLLNPDVCCESCC